MLYSNALSLNEWISKQTYEWINERVEQNNCRNPSFDQQIFFRDHISCLFNPFSHENRSARGNFTRIRGFHTSKSVKLPVYWMKTDKVEIVARNNFYNWNASVNSTVNINLPDYFELKNGDGYLFLEGMEDTKYPSYSSKNRKKFSFCVMNNYQFSAVMWAIASQVKTLPNCTS